MTDGIDSLESISGLLKRLQIRVQVSSTFDSTVTNPFLTFTLALARWKIYDSLFMLVARLQDSENAFAEPIELTFFIDSSPSKIPRRSHKVIQL